MLHGGPEGVRDLGLLESALANLLAYSEQQDVPIARFAAAYAKGIVANHPFVDGNKRMAFTVSITFLKLNGLELTATKEDRVLTFWGLAAGEISEEQLALWFERNTTARRPRVETTISGTCAVKAMALCVNGGYQACSLIL